MAKQTINIGTTANDGTGETVRSAFDKVNDNFTELYDNNLKAGFATGSIDGSGNFIVDFNYGAVSLSLTKNVTGLIFSNAVNNKRNEVLIRLTQDSTGGRTFSTADLVTAGSLGLDISTTANAVSFITLITFDGSTVYGFTNGKNFG